MLENKEGQKVPSVVFPTRQNDEWVNVSTDDIFKGKTVIVFSLPGAFTPTCSSSHVPRFNELAPVFKQHGIDDIVCVSVNDAFVMKSWGEAQNASELLMLGDGDASFTKALGLDMDTAGFGGVRSQRYSMLIDNGVVSVLNVEQGGEFEVSKAEVMLSALES